MLSPLPAPLTTPDCDCTNLDGFMLNVERLMSSELVALAAHDVIGAALLLWCRAWKQIPAASLPDDDRVNAAFARLTPGKYAKIKAEVLRGFIKCSDGRLYHKTLAEEAMRAFERKKAFQRKRDADAERLRNWRRNAPAATDETHTETPNETRFVAEGQDRTGHERTKENKIGASQAKADKPKRERKVLSGIPDDFPAVADQSAAETYWRARGRADLCARLSDEMQRFREHHSSKGSRMADWSAAWRTWYGNAVRFNPPASTGGRHGGSHKPAQQSAVTSISEAFSERNPERPGDDVQRGTEIGRLTGPSDKDRSDQAPSLFGSPAADAA